jgi:hypothetical protein
MKITNLLPCLTKGMIKGIITYLRGITKSHTSVSLFNSVRFLTPSSSMVFCLGVPLFNLWLPVDG